MCPGKLKRRKITKTPGYLGKVQKKMRLLKMLDILLGKETQNAKALRWSLSTRNYSDPLGHLAVFGSSIGCQNLGQGFLLAPSE